MPENNEKLSDKVRTYIKKVRHLFTDHMEGWYDVARKTRNPMLNTRADATRMANGLAQVDIGRAQTDYNFKRYKNFTDENGNKVEMGFEKAYDLYNKIPVKDKNTFLVHQLNIDRLKQGKDQFGISMEESVAKVEELRNKYKDIDKWSENIYQYYRNMIKTMVDSGRIPQSKADEWLKETPHYVHIQRDVGKKSGSIIDTKSGKVDSDRLIQKIKGGSYPILPIKQTTAQYTEQVREAIQLNKLGKEYMKTVGVTSTGDNAQQVKDLDEIFGFNSKILNDDGNNNYSLTIYDKGMPIEIPLTKELYEGLKPMDVKKIPITSDVVKLERELITNKDPFFGLYRNPIKDAQDLFLYSKFSAVKNAKTYGWLYEGRTTGKAREKLKLKNLNKIEDVTPQDVTNLYYDCGNAANSFFANGKFKSEKGNFAKGVEKALSPIEKGNNFMESMPRVTEFWNTIQSEGYTINKFDDGDILISQKEDFIKRNNEKVKNGEMTQKEYDKKLKKLKEPTKTVEEVLTLASHNAAEVTVNFKRGGAVSKFIDKNISPYFSPGVQGAAKFGRTFTEAVGDAKAGDFKAAKRLVSRAAILGVAPALLSAAMYGDDDDYEEIQDYQKDKFYLIKRPNGKWWRIPKGRAISLFQSGTRRVLDKAEGKEKSFKGYGGLIIDQIAPSNPIKNTFGAPVFQAISNKSWSGNPIVSKYMEDNYAPEDQFNEKTDELSKKLGKQLHISPMKINYILDQYSGVIGNLTLPAMSLYASSDTSNPILANIKKDLSFDQANSSKNTNEFYDNKSKINKKFKKANASDETKLQKAYMGTMSQELYPLTEKKRNIQMDKNLSKKEKYEQVLEVQKQINELTKKAVKNLESAKVDKYTATIGGKLFYRNEDARNGTGWSQENEETTQKREALGLSPEKYYYYKNDESYKTSDGYTKSITSGKNAKQTIAMVEAFNFDPSDYLEYKSKLSKIRGDKGANGKTIRYSARKKKIAYLNTLPISSVEKAYLMKQSDRYYRSSDNSLKKAIKSSSMSEEDKKQIYSYLRLGR